MALDSATVQVTDADTLMVAAPGATKRINVLAIKCENHDTVNHTVLVKDGATEVDRFTVPAGGTWVQGYGPDRHGAVGKLFSANTALNLATLAAPTASSVSAIAFYGRVRA